jgi:hypothetical protein
LVLKKTTFILYFLRKKDGKILKIPDMPAAAAWKFLKISLHRRRRGCIDFLSAAAAQKFLKLSPSRRRRLYFFGKNRRRRRLSRSAYTSTSIEPVDEFDSLSKTIGS